VMAAHLLLVAALVLVVGPVVERGSPKALYPSRWCPFVVGTGTVLAVVAAVLHLNNDPAGWWTTGGVFLAGLGGQLVFGWCRTCVLIDEDAAEFGQWLSERQAEHERLIAELRAEEEP